MNSTGNFPFINLYSIFDAKRNWENRAGAGSAQIPIYRTEYYYIAACDEQSQTAFLIPKNKKGVVR